MADGIEYFAEDGPNLSGPEMPQVTPDFSDLPFSQIMGAGFRRENIIGAAGDLHMLNANNLPDEGFDPFAEDYLKGYEEHAGSFIGVANRTKGEQIKATIDRQKQDLEILSYSGGVGTMGILLGAISDPTNLLPLANLNKITRLGRALSGAKRGAVVAAGQETILQAAQVNRSGVESFANISATSFMSGVISGLVPGGVWKTDFDPADAAKIDADVNVLFKEVRQAEEAAADTIDEMQARAADVNARAGKVSDDLDEISRGIDELERRNAETGELFEETSEDFLIQDLLEGARKGREAFEAGNTNGVPEKVATVPQFVQRDIDHLRKVGANSPTRNVGVGRAGDDQSFDVVSRLERIKHDSGTLAEDLKAADGATMSDVDKTLLLGRVETFLRNSIKTIGQEIGESRALKPLREALEVVTERPDEIFAEGGEVIPDVARKPKSVGAAADPEASALTPSQIREENALMKAWGMEKIPDNPLKRLLNSTDVLPREIAQQLFESPYYLNKHLKGEAGGPPVEAAIRKWWWPVVNSINETDRQFHLLRGAEGKGRMRTNAKIWVGDAMDRVQGREAKGMSLDNFRKEVTAAMRNGDEAEDANEFVTAAARHIRKNVFEPMHKEATELQVWSMPLRRELDKLNEKMSRMQKAPPNVLQRMQAEAKALEHEIKRLDTVGPEITTAKGFVPRFFRHDKIMAQYDEFKAIIRDHLKGRVDPDVLEGEVQDMVERILREKPYRPIGPENIGRARSLRERSLPIPDTLLTDFLENDIEALMRYYVRSTSADIELTRVFKSHDMADVLDEVEKNFLARVDVAKGKAAKVKLRNEMNSMLEDIRAGRDRLRGTYGLPDDPYRPLSRFYRGVKQFNYMTMLGGVVISSIPDVGRLVMTEGVERAFKHAIVPWVRQVDAISLSLKETNIAGTALDLHLGFRAQAFAELGDTFGRHSGFERALMGGSQIFSVMNLFNSWNTVMKGMAGSVISHRIGEVTMKLSKGRVVSQKEIAKLARANIDTEMAKRIGKQFEKHSEVDDGLMLPNTEAWDDAVAADHFRMAMAQDVDRTIVTPGAGDRSLFMSKELGSVIFQFKSFSMASAQQILMPALQMPDARVVYGAAMMIGLGVLVDELKRRQYGGKRPQSTRERLLEGFDRSGLSGYFMDINRVVERMSDNKVGLNAMMGVPQPYNASFRGKIGSVLGPTADQMARSAEILTDIAGLNYDRYTASALRRMMIGNNLFWASPAFDQIEKGMRP